MKSRRHTPKILLAVVDATPEKEGEGLIWRANSIDKMHWKWSCIKILLNIAKWVDFTYNLYFQNHLPTFWTDSIAKSIKFDILNPKMSSFSIFFSKVSITKNCKLIVGEIFLIFLIIFMRCKSPVEKLLIVEDPQKQCDFWLKT